MAQPAHATVENRISEATSRSETENKSQTAANQSAGNERSIKTTAASSTRLSDDVLDQSGTAGAKATRMGTEAAQRSALQQRAARP